MSHALETFRKNVAVIRKTQKISVQQIADKLGVHREAVGIVLRGKEGVSIERADRIADAVGVPLHKLLEPRQKAK